MFKRFKDQETPGQSGNSQSCPGSWPSRFRSLPPFSGHLLGWKALSPPDRPIFLLETLNNMNIEFRSGRCEAV